MITPEQLAASGSEDSEQMALMCWAALNFNLYPELERLFHIANGGFRNKREAGKLKAMGVKKGVPDLCLPVRRGDFSGLWVELKKLKKGKVSEEQNDWIAFLRQQGYGAIVCYGWINARDVIVSYLEWK